ncbi:hypothetical protein RHMOL_Rhmol07G0052500 [Rhododendron molle]|uniref:Uncharacterized protein n=2 Tax=Rhododendron molle TaxID=49168 RepID=A0ACC0LJ87_RHOML|nr:hypothetical protein RHMOL_Rhmol12G0173600 [Rhododendron molle]KAI8545605.1 hypothetical protein RHMOL_Rhmol07G0052500 [Rhododendron molle]
MSPSLCRRSISTSPISVAAVAVEVSDSPDLSRRRQAVVLQGLAQPPQHVQIQSKGVRFTLSVGGGVHSDSASAVPDPRSAVRGGGVGGAVSGDDAGCYSRFRVGTGSWST